MTEYKERNQSIYYQTHGNNNYLSINCKKDMGHLIFRATTLSGVSVVLDDVMRSRLYDTLQSSIEVRYEKFTDNCCYINKTRELRKQYTINGKPVVVDFSRLD